MYTVAEKKEKSSESWKSVTQEFIVIYIQCVLKVSLISKMVL